MRSISFEKKICKINSQLKKCLVTATLRFGSGGFTPGASLCKVLLLVTFLVLQQLQLKADSTSSSQLIAVLLGAVCSLPAQPICKWLTPLLWAANATCWILSWADSPSTQWLKSKGVSKSLFGIGFWSVFVPLFTATLFLCWFQVHF